MRCWPVQLTFNRLMNADTHTTDKNERTNSIVAFHFAQMYKNRGDYFDPVNSLLSWRHFFFAR